MSGQNIPNRGPQLVAVRIPSCVECECIDLWNTNGKRRLAPHSLLWHLPQCFSEFTFEFGLCELLDGTMPL